VGPHFQGEGVERLGRRREGREGRRHRFVLDMWRKHTGFGGAKAASSSCAREVPRIDGPVVIEDKANGPAIMEELEKLIPGLLARTRRTARSSAPP
jgi:hypothetical protein